MRVRLSFTAGAWAGATAAATLVSWAGVQIVTSAVTPSPVAVLPASRIASIALHAPKDVTPTTEGPTTSSTRPAPTSVAHRPSTTAGRPPPTAGTPTTERGPQTQTPTTSPSPSPSTSPTSSGPAPATTVPSTPPLSSASVTSPSSASSTTATTPGSPHQGPPAQQQVVATRGGEATVTCQGSSASLSSASPANGYQLYVTSTGPNRVSVVFANEQSEWQIVAGCVDGAPYAQTSGGAYTFRQGPGPGPYDDVPQHS